MKYEDFYASGVETYGKPENSKVIREIITIFEEFR